MKVIAYHEALGAMIPDTEIASKGGLSYLSAATAMRLAGRPEVEFVDFNGQPYLKMLNGSVVAVDIKVPGTDVKQRMWLPVMDRDNLPLAFEKTTSTDINNNRQRCLVKAIAAVLGNGMSVYLGHSGDGVKTMKMLGLTPESDLSEVTPVVATLKEGGAPYIEWNVGLAAARITDPSFLWEVVLWDGMPYREVLGGLMVDVDTVYRGKAQRLSLPVMDAAFNPIAADMATVFDWNKAVMRALTKGIAFNSGYGLTVYAEDIKAELGTGAKAKPGKDKPAADTKAATPKADAKADAAATEAKADSTPAASAQPTPSENAEAPAAVAESNAPAAEVAEPAQAATAASTETVAPAETAKPAEAATSTDAAPAESKTDAAPADASATVDVADAVARFKGVMEKRRGSAGVPGLLTLFNDLKVSVKFAEEAKPACYAVLVTALGTLVTVTDVVALVKHIKEYNAMPYLAQDARDLVAGRIAAVALEEAKSVDDDALLRAPTELMSAGIAADLDDVFRLAKHGNVAQETLTLLRELVTIEASFTPGS
ncbi:DUF1071 domain-containing protein [Burkholderia ambifaria]|uniref:Sak single strand annealing protein n=1 Tax=Burkholderia ambifaria TaxID=152480 RepID=UPI000F8009DF|nr:DUF1071 domain-containing protein [Burkholderia ambifaria]